MNGKYSFKRRGFVGRTWQDGFCPVLSHYRKCFSVISISQFACFDGSAGELAQCFRVRSCTPCFYPYLYRLSCSKWPVTQRYRSLIPPLWPRWWPENHRLWARTDRRVAMQSVTCLSTPALLQRKPVVGSRRLAASEFTRLSLALPIR